MANDLPTLPLMEGLSRWGTVRLRPDHLENVVHVELLQASKPELGWRPLYSFTAVAGKVAMRIRAEKNDRILVYDATTNTFSDLAGTAQVRNAPDLRTSEVGKDDNDRKDDSRSKTNPRN